VLPSDPTRLAPAGRPAPPSADAATAWSGDATRVAATGEIAPGTLLANTYRVLRLVGGGGMGVVYEAEHVGLGTRHAVKVIRPANVADQAIMDLFYREARVLRGVRHDAVVSYDGFMRDAEGRDYLVMEYVSGPSLAERMRDGPLPPSAVLALRDRLALGLDEAHRKGAVHRDISPDNLILPENRIEAAKLIDFGLCKLTDPGQQTIIGASFAGKLRYASPEQFGLFGGNVDQRSDIYSVGLVLAAAARGKPLDMGDTFEAAIAARRQVPPLDDVPAALHGWLRAMLQPNPEQRPASMAEVLARWPASGVAGAKPPERGRQSRRGSRVAWAAGLVLAVGAAGAAVWWWWPEPPEPAIEPPPISTPTAVEPVTAPSVVPDATAPDLSALLAAGRLDEAFALFMQQLGEGEPPAEAPAWALARALQQAGMLDSAFAVSRELALRGHGEAAMAIAKMYDPRGWTGADSPFSRPNAAKALDWYRRAAAAGVGGAAEAASALAAAGGE
jgi:eukaryotic-like serine/threonine-protein kinase